MIDESKVPDRDTCQKLTEDFAEITGTNEALAQTFLQDYEWDLDRSVEAFYKAFNEERERNRRAGTNLDVVLKTSSWSGPAPNPFYNTALVEKLFGEGKTITTQPPPRMKFLTWNLDGLDTHNLKKRTRAVIKLVSKHEPDIIFFQEVIPETADYIETKLPEYKCIRGGEENYFTMTLLRVFTIFYDKHFTVDYPTSVMGRNLLCVEAHTAGIKLQLINTHLESTAEHAEERKRQLKIAFDLCESFSRQYTVIFGGDLNLRDSEVRVPDFLYDLWEFCGSPKEFKYTWDMAKNTNNSSNFGRYKPKCRFDRVYLRYSNPKRTHPKHFALIGSERVPETQSFPSDHWGVVVLFELDHRRTIK